MNFFGNVCLLFNNRCVVLCCPMAMSQQWGGVCMDITFYINSFIILFDKNSQVMVSVIVFAVRNHLSEKITF